MNPSTGVGRAPIAGREPAPFDVRGFARTAHGSLRDELDLVAIADGGMATEARRAIAVLADLEGATMTHLRNVLVTATHKDARVTAFLVSWAYEKYWIADALRQIVGDAGEGERRESDAATTGRGPIRRAVAGFVQGFDVIGAHLALGYVDDLVLDLAYARLAATENPALGEAVARIRAIKSRHTEFFEGETRLRLTASPRAARLARREIRRSPWPLGGGAVGPADRKAFARFAAADGAVLGSLARGIRSIPGVDDRTAAAVVRRMGG
ncbi:hypothetical protein [Agromyces aureus]|uniref:Uncharacterized protein n=1 Tax=Agromyces aureus TaxID=453304 RepID=A0A191WGK7_9MICO|nr:hypothetical protein [Agromyces aureus]ANJ27303.1 hypothetical protein ATC03_11820 [Agromyces aureus]